MNFLTLLRLTLLYSKFLKIFSDGLISEMMEKNLPFGVRQRNQRSNCQHPLDHQKSKTVPEKHLFLFIDYAKAFDCVDHNKLWKILREMGIPDHLTCLLRNLYAGQKATVRTGHGTDWFQIRKGVLQGCILSPCLFNFYSWGHKESDTTERLN